MSPPRGWEELSQVRQACRGGSRLCPCLACGKQREELPCPRGPRGQLSGLAGHGGGLLPANGNGAGGRAGPVTSTPLPPGARVKGPCPPGMTPDVGEALGTSWSLLRPSSCAQRSTPDGARQHQPRCLGFPSLCGCPGAGRHSPLAGFGGWFESPGHGEEGPAPAQPPHAD